MEFHCFPPSSLLRAISQKMQRNSLSCFETKHLECTVSRGMVSSGLPCVSTRFPLNLLNSQLSCYVLISALTLPQFRFKDQMHRGHNTALAGWGPSCHSGKEQIPFCQQAGTYVIAVSQANARDNYAENQQYESISIFCGVRMGAKLDVQWTIKNSLSYTIKRSGTMPRTAICRGKGATDVSR